MGQSGQPIIAHMGLWFQKMDLIVLAKVPGIGVDPGGQDEYGAAALTCFLIFLSDPQVGENFKKTVS